MLSPTCDTEETLNNYKLLTSQFFKSRGGVSKTSSDLEAGKQKQNVLYYVTESLAIGSVTNIWIFGVDGNTQKISNDF